MHADLERIIALQRLDSAASDAQRRLAEEPERQKALEARLETARQHVTAAKAQLTDNQTARRALEKDVAVHQGRLSKFRDQLMAVKTNQEYQAMQKEIATAQEAVRAHEDRILDCMEEAEALTRELKDADAELKRQQADIARERQALEQERATLERDLASTGAGREALAAKLSRPALQLFEHVARQRKGLAVAEARDGHCMVCHVRLRPQVFNDVRRNDSLIQCESCLRILYFAATPATADGVTPSAQ